MTSRGCKPSLRREEGSNENDAANPHLKKTISKKKVHLCLPYISEHQVRTTRQLANRCGLSDVLTLVFKSSSLSTILRAPRPRLCRFRNCIYCAASTRNEDCCTKYVVYLIACMHCDSFYIGETSRTIRSRLTEHSRSNASLVYRHLKDRHASQGPHHFRWSLLHVGAKACNLRRSLERREIRSRNPNINAQLMSVQPLLA